MFLSLSFICGAINIEAQPRPPKVHYNPIPTPPPVIPGKKVHVPKLFNPVGHIYGLSVPGHKIMFNFCPNGRVYREGDIIGSLFTLHGNIITVYSNHGPKTVIATGKISRDGRHIDWMDYLNNAKYRIGLIG